MPFNPIAFLVFFLLYWRLFNRNLKLQTGFLLAASYCFYAVGDWRFLPLLAGSSLLNYWLGIGIHHAKKESARRWLLATGLFQGIGSLLFFKYIHSYLPLGLSFYTFRTMAYLLDIKRNKCEPTRDWVVFFTYIAFFPCIIAGPIDRPGAFIPQLQARREFDLSRGTDNMRRILLGLFKKMVIADNCAGFTGDIFAHYQSLPAVSLCIGAFLYTIEIYADFSGYSDMAIGIAGLLGFRVARNFNFPFFARNIAEFWRRWHITLTSWLTDYVFTPLSISLRNLEKAGLILAILINFTLIGIWHGPNWTFVLFGFLHGCYYIPILLGRRARLGRVGGMIATFLLVTLAFILFRADNPGQALGYYQRLFKAPLFAGFAIEQKVAVAATSAAIAILFLVEWFQQGREHALQIDFIKNALLRSVVYCGLILFILLFSADKFTEFIYLKF